jgi:hypothetical protein
MLMGKISVPQHHVLSGSDIFNLSLAEGKVDQFMISTPEGIHDTGYWHTWYRNTKDVPKVKPPFKCEVLFGVNKTSHEQLHLKYGTQAFGSYLRGHINAGERIKIKGEWVRPTKETVSFPFIVIQQYYRSDWRPKIDYLPTQLRMDRYGIAKMLEAEIIASDTMVYLEDHSWFWDQFICDPFCPVPAGKLAQFLNSPNAELKFREYSRYGKDYADLNKVLNLFQIDERWLTRQTLAEPCIQS